MNHRNNFNLLRLLAASQVVAMHSYAHLHLPTNHYLFLVAEQFPGVACFFVISGFLVSDSYLRSENAGVFFFKRAIKIYPALIINVAILEAIMFLAGQNPGALDPSYPAYLAIYGVTASADIAKLLTGLDSYTFTGFFQSYPSQVLWTLTVELSFYLIVPALLVFASKARTITSAVITALMIASVSLIFKAESSFYDEHVLLNISPFPYFWIFGLGVLARLYWDVIARFFQGRLIVWAVLYSVLTVFCISRLGAPEWLDYKVAPGWIGTIRIVTMSAVVISAAFSYKSVTAWMRLDKIDVSYGMYLWHMLVVMCLIGIGYTASNTLWPIVFGGGLGLATISWFIFERPIDRIKRGRILAATTKLQSTHAPSEHLQSPSSAVEVPSR